MPLLCDPTPKVHRQRHESEKRKRGEKGRRAKKAGWSKGHRKTAGRGKERRGGPEKASQTVFALSTLSFFLGPSIESKSARDGSFFFSRDGDTKGHPLCATRSLFPLFLFLLVDRKKFLLLVLMEGQGQGQQQQQRQRPTVAIACIFRNSAFYLREWIEYHRLVGVCHFFMCDHLSVDGGAAILQPYVEAGIMTLTRNDTEFDAHHFEAQLHAPFFNEAVVKARGRFDWLACLDSDEFVVLSRPSDVDLPSVLASFMTDECAVLALNWQLYGTSGVQRVPRGLMYTECLVRKSREDDAINDHIKLIVRPDRIVHIVGPHWAQVRAGRGGIIHTDGRPALGARSHIVVDRLRINHYNTGDGDYFERFKVPFYRRYLQGNPAMDKVCARAREMAFCDVEDRIMDRWATRMRTLVFGQPRVCIIVHVGYADEWPYYSERLANVARAGIVYDLYATVIENQLSPQLINALRAFGALGACRHTGRRSNNVKIIGVPNRGLDGGGWLTAVAAAMAHTRRGTVCRDYDAVLKVHTKSTRNFGPQWRECLLDAIVGTPERAAHCVGLLASNPAIGIIGARPWVISEAPRADVLAMASRLGLEPNAATDVMPTVFIGGTMFWGRFAPLATPIVAGCRGDVASVVDTLTPGFPPLIETDGHMIERVFGLLAARAGLSVYGIDATASAGHPPLPPLDANNPRAAAQHLAVETVRDAVEDMLPEATAAAGARAKRTRVALTFDAYGADRCRGAMVSKSGAHLGENSAGTIGSAERQTAIPVPVPDPVSISVSTFVPTVMYGVPPLHVTAAGAAEAATAIEAAYRAAYSKRSDINEHIPTLCEYASRCTHVTECGVRSCESTWAFLHGLLQNAGAAHEKGLAPRLVAVDLAWHPNISTAASVARKAGIAYEFRCVDDVATTIEPTDLLFIDTWHIYGHLKRELAKHHGSVKRWIILHDTTVDADEGESIRMNMNIAAQVAETGYPEEEIRRGLWPAVQEFVAAHPSEWAVAKRWTNCNGLTVLERIGASAVTTCA